jgi:hypothetical protein
LTATIAAPTHRFLFFAYNMLRFQIIQKERSIPGGCYLKFHPPLHSPSFSFLLSFIFSLFISRQCLCVCVCVCLVVFFSTSFPLHFFFLPFAFSSPSRRWSVQQTIGEKIFRGNWYYYPRVGTDSARKHT